MELQERAVGTSRERHRQAEGIIGRKAMKQGVPGSSVSKVGISWWETVGKGQWEEKEVRAERKIPDCWDSVGVVRTWTVVLSEPWRGAESQDLIHRSGSL